MISLLYIDDEPGLLELGKLFLESAGGFEVSTALSGDEGLGQLAQHDFDAIVSDFQMPGMDGIELLKKVRKSFGTIPFVLFTGRGREEVVIEAINNGVDFYLQKGGDPKAQFAELAHKVRQSVSRRKAETALSESEKRLADIINFLPDATFAIDTHGVVIAWNRAMEMMTSVRAEDVLGKGDYEYALPFYHERRPLLINLVLENDPAIGGRYPFVKKEGTNLFSEITIPHFNDGRGAALWFTASLLYDRKGEVVGAIESIREITERKRAEEARYESERRFRELADLLPQGIYESDTEGRMTYVNRLALEMFGYTAEDVEAGLNALNVITPEDRSRAAAIFSQMVETGTSSRESAEYRAVRKDGSTFLVSIHSTPVYQKDRIIGIRGVIIDITTQKEAEETLLSAHREYTNLLDQIQDVYYRSDSEGRLVRASRSWATLFGYNDISECIGRSIADDFYFNPSDRKRVLAEIAKNGKVTGYEVILKKKDGTPVPVEISSHPYFDPAGKVIGIEGTFRDVTERKKAEEELRAVNEQLVASEEELRAQYDELARGEKQARMIETRLRYMLGFDEYAKKGGKELLEYAIEGSGVITGSTLGYLAFLNEDESELSMYAWSKNAMAECLMRTKPIIYKTEKTGLWGEAVRQRRPVITNDYAAPNPAKKGYPEGHPHIIRHMNVPVIDDDHIVLVAGVANKPTDYTENDVSELLLLVQGLWNILKRKQAEEKVKNSLFFLNALIDQSPNPTWIADNKGFLIRMNAACERLLHASEADLAGKYNILNDNIVGEQGFIPLVRSVFEEGQVVSFTMQYDSARLNGLNLQEPVSSILELTLFPVKNAAGMITNAVIIQNDITERKRAEAKLQEKTEELDQYFSTSLDLFCIADTSGNFRRLNPEWEKTLGYPLAELEGKRFLDFVHPDDLQSTLDAIGDLKSQKEVLNFTNRYRHRDGTYLWIEWRSMPKGDLIFAAARDITERKNATAALVESEEKYRNIINHAPAGMHFYELKPDGSLVFTGSNPVADRIIGVEHRRFIGKTIEEAFPALAGTEAPAQYRRIAADGGTWKKDQVIYDGETIHGAYAVTAFQISPGAMVASFMDITERKRAEEALFNSQQMLQAVLDSIPQRVFWKDRNSVFLGCNKPLALDAGYTDPADMVGKTDYDYASHATADLYRADDRQVMETGQPRINFEELQIRSDGSQAWLRTTKIPLRNKEGAIIGVLGTYEDITDRKKADAALRESEVKFKAVIDQSFEFIGLMETDGTLIVANRSALEFAGITESEVINRPFWETAWWSHSEEAREKLRDSIHRAASGETVRFETPLTAVDGNTKYFDFSVKPVMDGTGKIRYLIPEARDITDRRRTEQALRESEEKYRTLVESAFDGIAIHQDGILVYVNKTAARLLGSENPDEFIGRPAVDVVSPELRQRIAGRIQESPEKALEILHEKFLRLDGTAIDVDVTSTPGTWKGKPAGFVTFRDISERTRAEKALRESEEKFRTLVETNRDIIYSLSTDGTILYVSPQAIAQLGYLPGEMVGQNFTDFIHPDDIGILKNHIRKNSVAGSRIDSDRFRVRRKDGVYRWFEDTTIYTTDREKRSILTGTIRDITEEKAAHDALRESEGRYRSLIELSPDAVVVHQGGKVLYANPAALRFMGAKNEEEIIGREVISFVHPDDQAMALEDFRQLYEEGKVIPLKEERLVRINGDPFTVEVIASPIQYQGNRSVLVVFRDITGRKRAEDELLRLKVSTDRSSDEIFWMDFAGNILYVNDAACRVTGYSREEFLKMKIFELDPDFSPEVWDASVADLRVRKTQCITTRHRRKDGVIIDVEIVAVYVNQYDQEYSFAYVRDITDRKRTEDALRENSRKYAELFELGGEAIFLIDNETGALLEANAAACEMYGYPRDILLTMKNTDLSAEREETKKVTTESPAGVVRVPVRYHRRKDGTVFPVEIIGRFFTWNGRPVHIAAIRDITVQNQSEAAILEANRKLNLLNSITRHDIRNQLTVAQGYTQLAALSKPEPAVMDFLARIATAIETIQRQIEFTKTYQELGVHAPSWFRLTEVVSSVRPDKIALRTTCNVVEIFADPMIDRVFFNLFDNAMKYGERVTAVTVGCTMRENNLVITFADNGTGIAPGEKQKIFEKGYGRNTGLGLFLVREILAITGMSISETGTPGEGAVFEIVVPKGAYRNTE